MIDRHDATAEALMDSNRPLVQTTVALLLALLLAACGAQQQAQPEPPVPSAGTGQAAPAVPSGPPRVFVAGLRDARAFLEDQADPARPSIDLGSAAASSAAARERLVGRERNAFGAITGDVLLPGQETVTALVRGQLESALGERGYALVPDAAGGAQAVSVLVREFWVWFEPGFWTLAMHARIATTVRIGDAPPLQIEVQADDDTRRLADQAAWGALVDRALGMYRDRLLQQLPPPQ